MRQLNLVASLCALLVVQNANSIVIRHDRSDARYMDLAKSFRAYGDVVEAGSALIHPRWLLTAGHVAVEISPYTSFATVNGRRYAIDRVIMHPDYVASGMRGSRDIALLRLKAEVKGVEPVLLYRANDEANQVVHFFGRGQTGTGETGPATQDKNLRGATNKIESADANSIYFQFDAPETATDLEGISGPGDSGGPALLKVNGKWAIAGVSSANRGNGKGLCRYGTTEIYARVSTVAVWIDETINNPPESSVAWKITAPFKGWPKTRPAEVGSALIEAFNSNDPTVMEAFNLKHRDAMSLGRNTPEARAKAYADRFKSIGKLTVVEYAEDPSGKLLVLLRNEKRRYYQLSLYFFDRANIRFDGYWIGDASKRQRASQSEKLASVP